MALPSDQHQTVELAPILSHTVAAWPVGNFLENIVALTDGTFIVAIHNRKELHRVTSAGERQLWVSMPASPAGMMVADDSVFVVGGEPGTGPHHLYEISAGVASDRGPIPGTLFLNGFTLGPVGWGYAVDSIVGAIIAIDLRSGASEIVLRDERLGKISAEPLMPGANGIKVGDGALYITNTERALVLRAQLDAGGWPTGTLDILEDDLRGDDLALDTDGALYIATHIHNSLVRLSPGGSRVVIAGPDEGMAGSTACVFGVAPADRTSLFVTTTGGMIMPLNGEVQEAKLVRLEVGKSGRPIHFF